MRFCWRCGERLHAPPPTTCAACGQEHFHNPLPCGGAIVVRDRRVLLLRRANEPYRAMWDTPGGFCNGDEHPMHAAERELAEEAGIEGRATAYVGTWLDRYGEPAADGLQLHSLISFYLVTLSEPQAEPVPDGTEITEAGWFDLSALPADLAFPRHTVPVLRAVREMLDGAAGPLPDRTW
ncbi:MAG TPA: NUDIX domain-containing protein [Solirubrobacteraceae bacterium]|nr:NUDIX domain-containing protein [Solirubrobacteraceae bacterium]